MNGVATSRHFFLVLACLLAAGCNASTPPSGAGSASTSPKPLPSKTPSGDKSQPITGPSAPTPGTTAATPSSRTRLVDVAKSAGLDFVYHNGRSGRALMVESTGGGGGWLDFDRDGLPDLFLVQGGDPLLATPDPVGDRFYRATGSGFRDVSRSALPADNGYGQGLAVGDFDNDGFADIFVTNIGPDQLLRNLGDGTFEDTTHRAGVGDPRWGASAAWGDLDGDGDLDLYVGNYLKYDVRNPITCQSSDGKKAICHPEQLTAEEDECFENLGDGTFRSCLAAWKLQASHGKSLGVVIADLAGNRLPDVFVANDTTANHLFVQIRPGEFEERAVELGCALSGAGTYQANMGVAFGDYDRNGFQDLYVTHFTDESNTLYANLGPEGFRDVTKEEKLHRPTLNELGFGSVMVDFDCDGRQELFIANGHIDDWRIKGENWYMRPQLFQYDGERAWFETSKSAGDYFQREYLGRAVSTADYDGDGDVDLLVVHQNAPAAVLRNDSPRGRTLQLVLQGTNGNRDAIGTKVTLETSTGTFTQELAGGTSYCAAHQHVLAFGLGEAEGDCQIRVQWPGANEQQVFRAALDQRIILREGQSQMWGLPWSANPSPGGVADARGDVETRSTEVTSTASDFETHLPGDAAADVRFSSGVVLPGLRPVPGRS